MRIIYIQFRDSGGNPLSAHGEGAIFIANCKELSAMIKTGTVTITDIQCEYENWMMDIMIGANDTIKFRNWEGAARSDSDMEEEEDSDD